MSTIETPQEVTSDYVDVSVIDVRRILPNDRYTIPRNVAVLQETGGEQRLLGIWFGSGEGEAILILMSGIDVPRPLTFNFAINLLKAAGGQLREVRVNRIVDKTHYAEAIIQAPGGPDRLVDARPSDPIPLALVRNVPIRVAESVMREVSMAPEFVERHLAVDGTRVLGKAELAREMERLRLQRDAELQQQSAEFREPRTSTQRKTRVTRIAAAPAPNSIP